MKVLKDIPYSSYEVCKLDLYLPDEVKEPPVYIYIHGGGLEAGYKTDVPNLFEGLLKNGVAVVSNGDDYYLFCFGLPMASDPNVALFEEAFYEDTFQFEPQVISVTWMDNDKEVQFEQKEGKLTVHTVPFEYGRNLVVRVAKIKTMRE